MAVILTRPVSPTAARAGAGPRPCGMVARMTGQTQQGAVVEFDHVTKHYDMSAAKKAGGVPGAVNDLSLTVPAGQICILVGPSGCGKTTSLKMVNRLIEPTSGRITIDGVDIAGA